MGRHTWSWPHDSCPSAAPRASRVPSFTQGFTHFNPFPYARIHAYQPLPPSASPHNQRPRASPLKPSWALLLESRTGCNDALATGGRRRVKHTASMHAAITGDGRRSRFSCSRYVLKLGASEQGPSMCSRDTRCACYPSAGQPFASARSTPRGPLPLWTGRLGMD